MTAAERIIKIVAEYFAWPLADVTLDTSLSAMTQHKLDDLDLYEIGFLIEEEFDHDLDDEKLHGITTVRDFLKLVEPEGVAS